MSEQNQKLLVNGAYIYYEKVGNGDHVVLLLPGVLGSTKTDFGPQLEKFNKKAFTLIGWDPRGYGQSRPPDRVSTPDFHYRDAKDAVELMKILGYQKYTLIGWSDGANIAAIIAAKCSERIQKLVIWGGNSYLTETDKQIMLGLRSLSSWSPSMRQAMTNVYGEETFATVWHDYVDNIIAMCDNADRDIYGKELKYIKAETLIVHGDKDAMIPKFHAEHLHKNIKKSRLVCWADGKHNLHLRFADRFNKLVEEFLLQPSSSL